MKKGFLSCFLSLSLLLTMMPTMAFATDETVDESADTSEVCAVTDGCTLGAGHEGECVVAPITTLISELKIGEDEDTVSNELQTLSGDITIDTDTTWNQETTLTGNLTVANGITLTLEAQVIVSGNVTISGGGKIVRGEDLQGHLITVNSDATLTLADITIDGGAVWSGTENETLQRGTVNTGISASGALIYSEGSLQVDTGTVLQNNDWNINTSGNKGGAVYIAGGSLAISDGTICNNHFGGSYGAGVLVAAAVEVKITGGIIYGNHANDGAGLFTWANLEMTDGEISHNYAETSGGGLRLASGADATVNNSKISANLAEILGGGIFSYGTTTSLSISGSEISDNVVSVGEDEASSADGGGGIYSSGTLTINADTKIIDNISAADGGGIRLQSGSNLIMNDGLIEGNRAEAFGGGIYSYASTHTFSGGRISGNYAEGDDEGQVSGGGVCLANWRSAKWGDIQITDNASSISDEDDLLLQSGYDVPTAFVFERQVSSGALNFSMQSSGAGNISALTFTVSEPGASAMELLPYLHYIVVEGLESYQPWYDSKDSTIKMARVETNGGAFGLTTQFVKNKLPEPTKDGAIFVGWYTDPNFTEANKVTEDTTISTDSTYYAKWIGMNDMELQYGGKQKITASEGISLSGYQSDNPSVATVDASGNVTATGVGTATIFATGTYNGQQTTLKATVTVKPRVLTYTNADESTGSGSITYNYSGGHHALSESLAFQWKDSPNTKVTLVEGTDINYTYTVTDSEAPDGGTERTYDYLPMPVGNYDKVKFNLLNENYIFALSDETGTRKYLEINVVVQAEDARRAYLASAWPKADQDFVYTGKGVLPVEGTLNAYPANSIDSNTVDIGTFTVDIDGLNGTSFHSEVSKIAAGTNLSEITNLDLPTKPGTYIITASAEGHGYYLYKSLVFTIKKAAITVKADDQSVYVGDEMPQFTYTVSGLVGADTLKGTLSFDCNAKDTNKAGTYTITPKGAEVPNEELYNDTIQYETGMLTIQKGSSSGGASHPEAGSTSSSSSERYEIEKPSDVENGSIKVSDSKAEKGDTVTITVTPDEGYELDELAVYDEDGDEIDLTDKGDGKFTFEMPKGDVEIEVSFAAIAGEAPKADFADVAADAWYADAVQYVFENGMMSGTSETDFSPNLTTTRGMIMTILYRLEGTPDLSNENLGYPYADVDANAYYADAVYWARQNGIVSGMSAEQFAPNNAITREQMAAILYRYAQFKGYDVSAKADLSVYTDAASVGAYATDAMAWANDAQLITGTSTTTLTPAGNATRAQVATILMRFCENIAK